MASSLAYVPMDNDDHSHHSHTPTSSGSSNNSNNRDGAPIEIALTPVTQPIVNSSASGAPDPTISNDGDGNMCRICGSDEDPHLLICPCDCAGSLRKIHTMCLERWILTRPARDANNQAVPPPPAARRVLPANLADNADGRMTCEICHADYRIQVQYTFEFSRARCCQSVSIGHCFELFILIIMFAVCIAMWPILTNRVNNQQSTFGSSEADSILIPVISIFMCLLTCFTIYKVFGRWKRANSVIHILPNAAEAAAIV